MSFLQATMGKGSSSLSDLTDVSISSVANKDTLIYDTTSGTWINGKSSLNDLSNIAISSVANNNLLVYNSSTDKWVNGTDSLANLSDTNIASAVNNNLLVYNSSTGKWVNGTDSLANLSDTNITSPANNNMLIYNSSTGKWVNGFVGLTKNVYTATIPIISGTSTTVYVAGIQSTDTPIIDLNFSGSESTSTITDTTREWSKVWKITTQNNQITVYATEATTVTIPIQLYVVR